MNNDELLEFVEDSMQSPYVVKNGFFVKTDERWTKVRYDETMGESLREWECRVPNRREEPNGEPSALED